MWAFQYKHGDKPLEGFTIQRAAGRGGFGEVYYAISDSGREVALKAVTGYEQIELRGISQCMNLKNPHLVSIFDVKYNDQNRPFVIMEFVAGPSLRQLLDESPGGLGAQKTAFFLREIGKGLTFLHDCGIVHRDLKPGNIFYENGYVKIGDYGLSKAMEPTQHSGQTITVGTVHYMAPEIGGGRYDKSIDIYAMGAVLFEMLTGQPPFLGASAGEILMKHVSTEPDLSNIEEPFKTVIRKAMAKNPAERYQSVQEMVEAVFGAEHIQQSVSCFSPDSLSMIAQRVGQRVAVGGGSATPPPIPAGGAVATAHAGAGGDRIGRMFDRVGDRIGAVGDRMAGLGMHVLPRNARKSGTDEPAEEIGDPLCDPLSRRQRRVLALIMLLVIAAAAAILSPLGRRDGPIISFWVAILSTFGATLGTLLAGHRILPQMTSDSGFLRRLASGGTAAGLLMLCGMPAFAAGDGGQQERLALTALGAILALLLIPPPDLSPSREERVAFGPAVGAAALGFVAWIFTQGSLGLLFAILAGSHLLAQVLSPWDPFGAKRRMGLEGDSSGAAEPPRPTSPQPMGWGVGHARHAPHTGDAPTMAWPPAPAPAVVAAYQQPMPAAAPTTLAAGLKPVPVFARYLWLAAAILFIPTGIVLLVHSGSHYVNNAETVAAGGFGTGLLALAALGLVKMWQSTYRTGWRYAGRYIVAWTAFLALMLAAFATGTMHLHDGEQAMAIFVIVLSAILIPVVMFVRFTSAGSAAAIGSAELPVTPAPHSASPPPPHAGPTGGHRMRAARRRARWNEAQAWRVKGLPFHVRLFNFVKSLVVGTSMTTLLLIATAAWAFIAMNVPGMLAAGIPDKDIPAEMTRTFGFAKWPDLLLTIGYVVGWSALLLAAGVLVVARRDTYGTHILRGVVGVAVFAASLMLLDRTLHGDWKAIASGAPDEGTLAVTGGNVILRQGDVSMHVNVERGDVHMEHPPVAPGGRDEDAERVAAAVERYFAGAAVRKLPIAGGIALFGLVLMSWPARRERSTTEVEPADEPAVPPAAEHA